MKKKLPKEVRIAIVKEAIEVFDKTHNVECNRSSGLKVINYQNIDNYE